MAIVIVTTEIAKDGASYALIVCPNNVKGVCACGDLHHPIFSFPLTMDPDDAVVEVKAEVKKRAVPAALFGKLAKMAGKAV